MAAINKKFAIEKGLEVGTETLVADADTNKVAIGKTFAEYGLDVAPTSNFDGVVAKNHRCFCLVVAKLCLCSSKKP